MSATGRNANTGPTAMHSSLILTLEVTKLLNNHWLDSPLTKGLEELGIHKYLSQALIL